ncbi:SOS response transcriptional repressor, RecA-mediated autopeptidase [Pseudomonas syringae pv. coriandricola]|uniref:SOS response transcriptional repressor, RecA-mediated autopeptidase n=1 Tax=Pseudomonas syringae pv. coriandricola TaxID=264453 RepID=A0A3M4U6X7_9PSED|nr:S24 family peptidase [Pseudomonas syringae group genomosp. 3]RMR34988.1 Pyocin, transcriptional repressor, CI/C2 family [Pseudomonas syringae pv. coriandricola]RMU10734.1 SOS response transcriptional repressor, RecA-mediated autopeptidase [Pseudomonas syringae pv. coriandricola]
MVDKNELRASFAERLHEALNDAGIRTRGRGVDIHSRLKNMGVTKSPQAISKWLNGDAIAEADSMLALSSWLNVRREWLEYGVLPKKPTAIEADRGLRDSYGPLEANVTKLTRRLGKVPLISWVQAGNWCEANYELHDGETWLSCPVPTSKNGYALKVLGDSMTNPGPGRSYPNGCIIFVDPEAEARPGDRVIARVPRTNEATFKVLVQDAGRQFLKPINPQYPIIDITEETHICGKVVGAFIPE